MNSDSPIQTANPETGRNMIESEVAILGAGPAGSTAALFLSRLGIHSVLIDRAEFPRDKVCGDCLGGYVISILRQLGEEVFNRFIEFGKKTEGKGVHFFSPDLIRLSIPATRLVDGRIREVSLSRRMDFDNFLLEEVRRHPETEIRCGTDLVSFERKDGRLIFYDARGKETLKTRLAILATGSQSKIANDLAGYRIKKKNLAGGIRCYYEGIENCGDEGYIEFHFLREILPGYLWIFPVDPSVCNVGLGQRSDVISRNKTDLKKMLVHLISTYPHLRDRFSKARMIATPEGFPLALGSEKRVISGDNFLLAGDAGSLIEPFFGEGIGNAMYSGKFAAEQAARCLEKNNYSSAFNRQYDRAVYRKLGNALSLSTCLQQAAFHPWLVNRVFRTVRKKPALQRRLSAIINGDMAREPLKGLEFLVRSVAGF